MNKTLIDNIIQDEAGFSLMELLIGIFLLSVVSVMTTILMSGYFKGNNMVDETITRMAAIAVTRQTLGDDLFHHVAPSREKTGRRGEDRPLLHFTRTAAMAATIDDSQSSLQMVEYYLKGKTLVRRAYVRPNPTAKTPYRDHILLRNIANLKFRYLIGTTWFDQDAGNENSSLPIAPLAIELQWTFTMDQKNGTARSYNSLFRVGGHS